GIFSKRRAIKRFIRRHYLSENNIYYVGDETRDIRAAKKAGIKCIAVTWGLNSKSALEALEPSIIVNKPSELVKVLTKYKY
ncbi:MAG: HAD hydrolase-like protein, partial [Nitrospinota bacterium]